MFSGLNSISQNQWTSKGLSIMTTLQLTLLPDITDQRLALLVIVKNMDYLSHKSPFFSGALASIVWWDKFCAPTKDNVDWNTLHIAEY